MRAHCNGRCGLLQPCTPVSEPARSSLLQERLEGKALAFADDRAREIVEMEVGSRVTPEAHAAKQKGSSLLLLCIRPQRAHAAACTVHCMQQRQMGLTHCTWCGTLCCTPVDSTSTEEAWPGAGILSARCWLAHLLHLGCLPCLWEMTAALIQEEPAPFAAFWLHTLSSGGIDAPHTKETVFLRNPACITVQLQGELHWAPLLLRPLAQGPCKALLLQPTSLPNSMPDHASGGHC